MHTKWPNPVYLIIAIFLALLFSAGCIALSGCAEKQEPVVETHVEYRTRGLAVDVTDRHEMHGLGLPTKTDVVEFHMNGRWGWSEIVNGERHDYLYTVLPGGSEVWDRLYGLDSQSEAFKY